MKRLISIHLKKWRLITFISILVTFVFFPSLKFNFFYQEEIKLHGIEGEEVTSYSSPHPYPDVIFIVPIGGEQYKDVEQQEYGKETISYQRMTNPQSTNEETRFGLKKDGQKYVLEVVRRSLASPYMILYSDYSATVGYQTKIVWKLVK
ncbi:MAG TPA: hypothetical protein VGN20_28630 [Mucilaginibacter sp.]